MKLTSVVRADRGRVSQIYYQQFAKETRFAAIVVLQRKPQTWIALFEMERTFATYLKTKDKMMPLIYYVVVMQQD